MLFTHCFTSCTFGSLFLKTETETETWKNIAGVAKSRVSACSALKLFTRTHLIDVSLIFSHPAIPSSPAHTVYFFKMRYLPMDDWRSFSLLSPQGALGSIRSASPS